MWSDQGAIPSFIWKNRGKTRKIWVTTAGDPTWFEAGICRLQIQDVALTQSRSVACKWYISFKSGVSPTLRIDNLMRTVQVEGLKMSGVRLGVINKAWGKFLRFLPQDELHRKLEFPCRQNREIHYKLANDSQCRKSYVHEVGLMTVIYLTQYLSGRTQIFRWDVEINSGI